MGERAGAIVHREIVQVSDIFISYDSADKERVRPLVKLLEEQGWPVWWDRRIPPGRTFAEVIDEAIQAAKCVIVVWSVASVKSSWVKKEAAEGERRRILVPVLFDDVELPFQFREIHAAGLVGYPGSAHETELRELLAAVAGYVGEAGEETTAPAPVERVRGEPPPKPALRPIWVLSAGAAVLILALLLFAWQKWWPVSPQGEEGTPERATTAEPVETERGEAAAAKKPTREPPAVTTGSGTPPCAEDKLNPCILIEGGSFLMGSPEGIGESDEYPQHRVRLSSFYLQEHEVTNEEYQRFVASHGFPSGKERHPVVEVTWTEAMAYAEWLGGSLPTEAQWEFAARGEEGRTYPWGEDDPTPERLNYRGNVGRTTPVRSYQQGATPEGIYDLAGNVWEWCLDWYGTYGGEELVDPRGPPQGTSRVLRGGSFNFGPWFLRGASRRYGRPAFRFVFRGFRVAWSAAGGLE